MTSSNFEKFYRLSVVLLLTAITILLFIISGKSGTGRYIPYGNGGMVFDTKTGKPYWFDDDKKQFEPLNVGQDTTR